MNPPDPARDEPAPERIRQVRSYPARVADPAGPTLLTPSQAVHLVATVPSRTLADERGPVVTVEAPSPTPPPLPAPPPSLPNPPAPPSPAAPQAQARRGWWRWFVARLRRPSTR